MKFCRLVSIGTALLIALAAHGCATEKVLLRSDLERMPQLTAARPAARDNFGTCC